MKEDEAISAAIVKINPIITSTSSIIPTSKIAQNHEITSPLVNNENLKNCNNNEHSSFNGKLTLEEEHQEEEEEMKADEPMDLKIAEPENKPAVEEETCFKTPTLPALNKKTKTPSSTNKRRQPTTKVSADLLANGKTPCSDQTSNIGGVGVDFDTTAQSMGQQRYSDEELVREFVSIGKHSFFCPHSQQFLAKKYPGLNLNRNLENDQKEDIIKEIVIDEFSLLLFRSMDDFNTMKEQEDKIKEREEAQARQKQYEENLRLGKIKKKGRKSKIELKREQKAAKRRARKEQKEQRRREKEERRQSKLAQKQGQSSMQPEDMEEIQRKEAAKLEKEKQRKEEKKQQKQAKKIGEKKQQTEKRASKIAAAVQLPPSSSVAIPESLVIVPSTSNSALPQHSQLEDSAALAKIKIEKLDENQRPIEVKFNNNSNESLIGGPVKRPSSAAIGIATVHRNGLIQSPTNNLLLSTMPPANKIAKYESGLEEYGANKLLIGIAVSTASDQQTALTDKNHLDATKALEKELLQRMTGSASSIASTSSQYQLLTQQQEQLQQAFLKNPELAFNFHQSLATLYSIDPPLMNRATVGLGASGGAYQFGNSGGGSPIKTAATPQQQKSSQNEARISTTPLLSSFPLGGVPLASQLALAASQSTKMVAVGQHPNPSIPFKSGRWCNMHAVIAHEISKHQDALKKSPTKTPSIGIAGRQSSSGRSQQQEKKTSQQKMNVSEATNAMNVNNNLTPNIAAAASLSTSQLLQLQQNEQQQQRNAKANVGSNFASSSASNSSATMANVQNNNNNATANLQQQLNLLLAQQSQQQQLAAAGTLNDNLLTTSNLLARLQQAAAKPTGASSIQDNLLSSAKSAIGLSSISNQLFSPSSSQAQGNAQIPQQQSAAASNVNQQLFGRFPVQPLGPGTGSLTSGNSDAAAAAQLQQQAQLLASLQQQQAQFAALQQFPQQSLAASLLSQFGADQSSQLPSNSALLQQQSSQNLLSALINNSMGMGMPGFGQTQPSSILPSSTFDAFQSQQQSLPSSLNQNHHPLFAGANENGAAKTESILAAFLSGQTMEPKMAFPPQLPSSSSAAAANPLSSPALSIEQQLMRGQLGGQLHKLSSAGASSAIPPPPSSLLAGSTTPMNALGIEQELLMRQLRIAQMANGPGAAANAQNGPQKGGRGATEMMGGGIQNARQI